MKNSQRLPRQSFFECPNGHNFVINAYCRYNGCRKKWHTGGKLTPETEVKCPECGYSGYRLKKQDNFVL